MGKKVKFKVSDKAGSVSGEELDVLSCPIFQSLGHVLTTSLKNEPAAGSRTQDEDRRRLQHHQRRDQRQRSAIGQRAGQDAGQRHGG